MASTSTVRKYLAVTLLLFLAAAVAVVAAPPARGGGQDYAEAPMQVMTEGLTVEEHLARQADLSSRLIGELPAAFLESRVTLSPEEIDAIDRGPRTSTPLKIGLVKPLGPGVEVFGLDGGSSTRQPGRGATSPAVPTDDGGFVWALVVTSDEAGAIRLHVEGLSLPRNAELYFYSRAGEAFGPYREAGPNGTGEFWTESVFGTEGILQLRIAGPASAADLASVSFRVIEAGVITRRFAGEFLPSTEALLAFCGNPSCIVDASCNNGTPADPAKLAVAKMEWIQGAFIYTCSGGLISDNNPSQSNFFLTANHCVSKNNNAQNVQFYWRFATSSCNGACPSNNGWPYKTTGSTVSKTGRKGDFTLLHLNANPPSGSVFLGWTNAPIANSNGADLFRISNPNFGPQVYSRHDVDTSAPTCSGWPRGERIYSRDAVGATDGGSSGSPVVNGSSQVVGQLSGACGFNVGDPCDAAANATVDGAFAFYYAQVQPFLNP
jgi:V8-like Glu-specific endopeptidase